MDKISAEQRHKNMSAIRGNNTRPEIIVRKYLWSHGFRYRLNHKRLPGRPDVVLKKYRTCIFVNGCFWHGHNLAEQEINNEKLKVINDVFGVRSSECCKIPKSNTEFWVKKIYRNKERDREVQIQLAKMGWHCIVVWECELKPAVREATLRSLVYTLNSIYLDNLQVKRYDFSASAATMVADDSGVE